MNQRRNNRSSPTGEIRTKDEPKNAKLQNMRFIKIDVSFSSLIPCLILPTDEREKSDTITAEPCVTKKCYLLRLDTSTSLVLAAISASKYSSIASTDSRVFRTFLCLLAPNLIRIILAFIPYTLHPVP